MYIKQVIIQGFRSYRDQTVIDPFSKAHNVVVGRNGSGKSNFFLAIQFVLSDEFSHMRQEERQQLLHEGTGPRVVSAYVEIIFDNSDSRIPIDKDEITLRRVIGSKKDQYFLDKKNVTKGDVINLLESAGFSKSNPYYIVKQGRINQLAVAKDNERLKLLREVAGTRVYDERKAESETILRDTESKRDKIDDLLKYIEERLKTLETEKEELKTYQKWDKERRCLEYTIHEKELKETREKLDSIQRSRATEDIELQAYHREAEKAAASVEKLNHEIKGVIDQCSILNIEKRQLDEERQEQIKQKTKLELTVKDLKDSIAEDENVKEQERRELEKLKVKIAQKEAELDTILPTYNEKNSQEEEYQNRLQSAELRRTDLYSKQGRDTQFQTKENRDQWIRNELKSLRSNAAKIVKNISKTEYEVEEIRNGCSSKENEIAERNEHLETRKREMDDANRRYNEMRRERDNLNNIRKELWRKENAIDTALQNTKNDLMKAERDLRNTMSKSVATGIDSVIKIVQEHNIGGVYGPLIANFVCDKKYYVAVEATAGGKLFNIIVDNDNTSKRILHLMNRMGLPGVATFLPLNRLNYPDKSYPTSSEVKPMIHEMRYQEAFKPAMKLAFGKMLICRDKDVCSQFSKGHDLDTVTIEGDKYSCKGTLEGGYMNSNCSRLLFQHRKTEYEAKKEKEEAELEEVRRELEEIDGRITRVLADLQKIETEQIKLRDTYNKTLDHVKSLMKSKQQSEASLGPKMTALSNYNIELERLTTQVNSFEEELCTELLSQLSRSDQEEIERLNGEIMTLKEKIKSVLKERSELEGKKQKLEDLLRNNLYKRRDGLQTNLEDARTEDKTGQLEVRESELETTSRLLEDSSARITDLEEQMSSYKVEVKKLQDSLEEMKTKEKHSRNLIEEDSKLLERIANKKSLLVKKKEDCMKKIRELGSLPADAFEKFQKTSTKQLWAKLKTANDELKQYSHVNKKALDQFVNFSEQKEKLIKRKKELYDGHECICDLMEVLEQRKHEAILFTFKQVSHNFSDIFKQLVPGGKAQLIMKKEAPRDNEDESSQSQSDSSSQRSKKAFDEFSGISIKISFTGRSAETLEMNQLSGGQKTLVALTLIFAIQKCDPAPFYLFDEIDQALDPQYRKSVAAMIHTLADRAQFITTTFRPELLESATKFYGVQFKNKVSHILSISKEEAKDFVEDDSQESQSQEA